MCSRARFYKSSMASSKLNAMAGGRAREMGISDLKFLRTPETLLKPKTENMNDRSLRSNWVYETRDENCNVLRVVN